MIVLGHHFETDPFVSFYK